MQAQSTRPPSRGAPGWQNAADPSAVSFTVVQVGLLVSWWPSTMVYVMYCVQKEQAWHIVNRMLTEELLCVTDCSHCPSAPRLQTAMYCRRTQCVATSAAEPAPPTAGGELRACTSSRQVRDAA